MNIDTKAALQTSNAQSQTPKAESTEAVKTRWMIVEAPESMCSYHPNATADSFERHGSGRGMRRTKAVIMIPVPETPPSQNAQADSNGTQKKS